MEILVLMVLCLFLAFGLGQFFLLNLPFPFKLFALIPPMLIAAGAVYFGFALAWSQGWDRFGQELLFMMTVAPAAVGALFGAVVWGVLRLIRYLRA